jgi:single-strand DNA-binding protein
MRYTPNGTAVTSFTVLTFRGWKDDGGSEQQSPEYSNVVVWSKLAEICNQLLAAGSKVFIEGRLQTRSWEDQENIKHYKTEIIADDMVLLGGRAGTGGQVSESDIAIPANDCLNRVQVIGNLARDPELRYLPSGTAVTTFVVATNRSWTNSEGVRQESTEYHNVVAWNTMAENSSKDLVKGQKVFLEGRLQNRSWEGEDGVKRYKTEIVASFIIPSTTRQEAGSPGSAGTDSYAGYQPSTMSSEPPPAGMYEDTPAGSSTQPAASAQQPATDTAADTKAKSDDDIPF